LLIGYLPQDNELVRNLKPALPFILLVGALLVRPERRLPERIRTPDEGVPPALRTTLLIAGAAVLLAIPLSNVLSDFSLIVGTKGLVFACVTLSLVLLTGLSGQVSLMQMSFAGVGAVVLSELGTGVPWLVGMAVAGLAAGALGCLVAVPVLRLRGIYLALLTLAFAILMDGLFFGNSRIMGGGGSILVPKPEILGVDLDSDQALFVVASATAALFAVVFLAVRRSSFGRMLSAMRDSPPACQTLGMSLVSVKLRVFGLSAALAGLAGGLFGSFQSRVGQLDFLYFRSLTVLLVAAIFGITSVTGAFLGAFFFVVLPEVLREAGSSGGGGVTGTQALQPLIIGILAIAVARRPEGIAGRLRLWLRHQWARLQSRGAPPPGPDGPATADDLAEQKVAVGAPG
jgi:branched-chain amino acid transport system permease protein